MCIRNASKRFAAGIRVSKAHQSRAALNKKTADASKSYGTLAAGALCSPGSQISEMGSVTRHGDSSTTRIAGIYLFFFIRDRKLDPRR